MSIHNMDGYKPLALTNEQKPALSNLNSQTPGGLPAYSSMKSVSPLAMSYPFSLPNYACSQMRSRDPMTDLTSMMSQVMQLFLLVFTSGIGTVGSSSFAGGKSSKSAQGPGNDNSGEKIPEDPHQKAIQGEDPKSNSGALAILHEYSDRLPAKNGKVKLNDLKKFLKNPPEDVPEEVTQAAKTLTDNEGLYDLLCAKSNSTADKGLKLQILGTDWSKTKIDIDNLEGVDDDVEAVTILKKNVFKSGYNYNMDLIKDIAFGKPNGDGWDQKIPSSKFKDPEVQAAALRIVAHPDIFDELDAAGTSSGTTNGWFNLDAVNAWLKENK